MGLEGLVDLLGWNVIGGFGGTCGVGVCEIFGFDGTGWFGGISGI